MKGLCHLLCNCSTYRYVCIKHIFAWVVFNKSMISTKVSCSPSMSSKTRRETKKLPRYHQFGRLREADFWRCHGALGVWGGHIWLYDFDFGGWKEGMIGVTRLKKIHISPPSMCESIFFLFPRSQWAFLGGYQCSRGFHLFELWHVDTKGNDPT